MPELGRGEQPGQLDQEGGKRVENRETQHPAVARSWSTRTADRAEMREMQRGTAAKQEMEREPCTRYREQERRRLCRAVEIGHAVEQAAPQGDHHRIALHRSGGDGER